MIDVFTLYVCVLVTGFHNVNQTGVIIMISHIMDYGNNEAGELHFALIGVITLARVHFCSILVGVSTRPIITHLS